MVSVLWEVCVLGGHAAAARVMSPSSACLLHTQSYGKEGAVRTSDLRLRWPTA